MGRRHRRAQPQVKDPLGAHMTCRGLSRINVYPGARPPGVPRGAQAPAWSGPHCPPGRRSRPRARPRASCGWTGPSCWHSTSRCPGDTVTGTLPSWDGAVCWALAGGPGGPGRSACALRPYLGRLVPARQMVGGKPFVLVGRGGPGWAELSAGWVRDGQQPLGCQLPNCKWREAGGHPPRPCSGPALHPAPHGPRGLAQPSLHS